MVAVFKYPVSIDDYFTLKLPRHAEILHVAEQHGKFQLSALVDPDAPVETRRFRFAGTGHPINESPEKIYFICTVMSDGGSLVFHFFEVEVPGQVWRSPDC